MSLSRRSFLKGAGALAVAAGLSPVVKALPPVVKALPPVEKVQAWVPLTPAQVDQFIRLQQAQLISVETALDMVGEPARGVVYRWADDALSGSPRRGTRRGGS